MCPGGRSDRAGFSGIFLGRWQPVPALTARNVPFELTEGFMGRFSRSWDLVGESFSILWKDKQLMLFPVLSGISCVMVTVLLAVSGLAIFLPAIRAAGITPENFQHSAGSPEFMAVMFVFYLANYFVIVFFNVALVGVANSRLTGDAWTFDQGLQLAWKRKWVILQWAFVAATVGMVLRMLSERAGFIGRIVISVIGIAWNLACYFVVPVLAFEDLSPGAAIYRSSELFRETWGEKVVGGFSMGLVFFVLMLPGFALWIGATQFWGQRGIVIGGVVMGLYFLALSVMSSAVQGIFNAALYRYACDQAVPQGFSKDLIASAWSPKE
jgi:Family of unknown function (DUF6159)